MGTEQNQKQIPRRTYFLLVMTCREHRSHICQRRADVGHGVSFYGALFPHRTQGFRPGLTSFSAAGTRLLTLENRSGLLLSLRRACVCHS